MKSAQIRWISLGIFLLPVFLFGTAMPSLAGMASENYRITTSTLSGGGGVMGSASYQMNLTLGQPSPLMDTANPPYSGAYSLYPGFWYTLGLGLECSFDLDGDGDVDGKDLAEFAGGLGIEFEAADVVLFAFEFGKDDCAILSP